MRTIALMNQKGGVGKTTTTVNLGAALADAGAKVCLIDLDPQAHLTINYGVEPTREIVSIYNVLVDDRPLTDAMQVLSPQITVIPSSIDLAAAEIELVAVLGREQLLKKKLEAAAAQMQFDYLLLDCPPSLGLLTINALAAAKELIIPMQPHFLALQGMAKLLETVQLVNRRMNPALKVAGLVLTMYDTQAKLSGEIVGELERFVIDGRGRGLPWSDAVIYESRIRRNIKLAESPSHGQTILQYGPTSAGANDYRALAREIMSQQPAAATAKVEVTINPSLDPAKLINPVTSKESVSVIEWWKRLRWPIWFAAGLYWAAIFTATHLPPRDVPNTHLNDKVEHIGAYGLLLGALSLCVAPRLARSWRWALILLLVAAAYGAFDERTQPYFGRDCDIHDWYADMTGGTIAIVSMKFVLQTCFAHEQRARTD